MMLKARSATGNKSWQRGREKSVETLSRDEPCCGLPCIQHCLMEPVLAGVPENALIAPIMHRRREIRQSRLIYSPLPLMNASRSALIVSACVVGMPCG
jgi:hypothetical protein